MSIDHPSGRETPKGPVLREVQGGKAEQENKSVRANEVNHHFSDAVQRLSDEHRRVKEFLASQTLESLGRARTERIQKDLEGTIQTVNAKESPPVVSPRVVFGVRESNGAREEITSLAQYAEHAVEELRPALADPEKREGAQLELLTRLVSAIQAASGEVIRTHEGAETHETIFCSEGADMLVDLVARSCADAGIAPEYASTVGHVGNFTRIGGRLYFSDVNGTVVDVTDNVEIRDTPSSADPAKGYRTYAAREGGSLSRPHVPQGLFFVATRIVDGVHAASNDDHRAWVLVGNTEGLIAQAEGDFASDPTLKNVGEELQEKLLRSARGNLVKAGIVSDPDTCDWKKIAKRYRKKWELRHAELRKVAPGIEDLQQTDLYREEVDANDAEMVLSRERKVLEPLFDQPSLLADAKPGIVELIVDGARDIPDSLRSTLTKVPGADPVLLERALTTSRDALARLWSRANMLSDRAKKLADLQERMNRSSVESAEQHAVDVEGE